MTRTQILAAALLTLVLAACGHEPPTSDEKTVVPDTEWTTDAERDQIVEARAKQALADIRQLTADQLVSDEVVRAAVHGAARKHYADGGPARGASYWARNQIFVERQCQVFAGYEDQGAACLDARYSENVAEGDYNFEYEQAGIPVSIAPIIAEMRVELYRIGRNHLTSPANLRAVYNAKKSVILDEYQHLTPEEQANFVDALTVAIVAFEKFRDDKVAREIYQRYLVADSAWLATVTIGTAEYQATEDVRRELETQVFDLYSYLFAGRRYAEGGDELVSTYIEILTDLQASLEAIPPLPDDN